MNFVYINAGDLINEREFMVSLGRLVFKATGVMSKKGIVKNCKKVGQRVAERMQETGGKIENKEIQQILSDTIGKKAASKIKITGDKECFIEACRKNLEVPDTVAEYLYANSLSAAIPARGNGALVNLRLAELPNKQIANLASHELEHGLYYSFSSNAKLTRLINKTSFGKKYIDKMMKKAPEVNEKSFVLQTKLISEIGNLGRSATGFTKGTSSISTLLKKSECKSKKELQEKIRQMLYGENIVSAGKEKDNAFVLKQLIGGLKDEKRAYTTGAFSEKYMNNILGKDLNGLVAKSELNATLYGEAIKVLKQELRHTRLNQVKRFFGLKPNTAREQAIIKQQQVTEVEKLDFAKVAKADSNSKVKAKLFENNK